MLRWLWSAGGLGLSPVAPGTFGTLGGVGAALLLLGGPAWWIPAAAGAVALLGVPLAAAAERITGRKDDQSFVLDEVAGYLVAVSWNLQGWPMWGSLAAAFVAFRAFDIGKPWPVRQAERLPSGWGVVADDLLAGLYANLLLRGCIALS